MSTLETFFQEVRARFPMLQRQMNGHPFIYLDSAATAQKPDIVIDTIATFYREQYGTVHRAVYATAAIASEMYELTRRKIASFIHASSENEIIFTRGTTAGINLAAHSFGKAFVTPGSEIMITEMEHHSNIVPWQMMAEERGAKLLVVPFFDNGELDMQWLKSHLSERTKMVACTHISNALGTINPVKEICDLAHSVGAKILIDGAQSTPHMPIDVQDMDADFFVFSGHKVIGPTGVGCLYGKRELLEQIPPFEGGGDMINTVTFEKTTYNTVPLKFEAGTPMIAEVIGLGSAIDFMQSLCLEKVHAWEQELLGILLPQMQEIPGVKVLGTSKHKAAIATFSVEGIHPLDLATLLDLRGIAIRTGHLCTQPIMRHYGLSAAARASLSFYNNKADIAAFIKALHEVIAILR